MKAEKYAALCEKAKFSDYFPYRTDALFIMCFEHEDDWSEEAAEIADEPFEGGFMNPLMEVTPEKQIPQIEISPFEFLRFSDWSFCEGKSVHIVSNGKISSGKATEIAESVREVAKRTVLSTDSGIRIYRREE